MILYGLAILSIHINIFFNVKILGELDKKRLGVVLLN